jgi:signal peptidase I
VIAVLGVCCVVAVGVLVLAGLRRRLLLVTVRGVSMEPTLHAGDRLLVRRAGLPAVGRGEIVVIAGRRDPADPTAAMLVKRAVALPGDPVPAGVPGAGGRVPPGRLVVLGDNAARSHDSRALGPLPGGALVGLVVRPVGPTRSRRTS